MKWPKSSNIAVHSFNRKLFKFLTNKQTDQWFGVYHDKFSGSEEAMSIKLYLHFIFNPNRKQQEVLDTIEAVKQ